MNATDADEIADLKRFVGDLNAGCGDSSSSSSNSSCCAIAVEGRRDANALKSIGVTCRILEFHRYGGLDDFADSVACHDRIILLFDRDRKGRYLAARAAAKLQRRTRVDLSCGKRLARITNGRIRFIEQLISYERLQGGYWTPP